MNRRKKTLILSIFILGLILAIYGAGLVVPEAAYAPAFRQTRLAPSIAHPFGTDALGRDLFWRTVKGLSVSLTIGIVASLVSSVIALIVGICAAVGSKKLDGAISWVIDLVMGVPHTVLIILISFAMGCGLKGLLIGICCTHWCSLARLIRAEVMQLRSQQYIAVSKQLGKSNTWILINHMLPHLFPQFVVGLVLMFPHAILHESAISFLGFGLPPEQPAIGIILAESMKYLSAGIWWPAVFPGITLVLIVFLIDKLGDNLRRLIDPYSAQE